MRFFYPVENTQIVPELSERFSSSFCINEKFELENISIFSEEAKQKLIKKIEKVHACGLYFNYLFDATCLGNIEFIKSSHNKIIKHFRVLQDIGVDYITLSIPYLIEIVLTQFPSLTPILSMHVDIDCVQRIEFYEKFGVKDFILPHSHNRNFSLLEKFSKKKNLCFHLVLNNTCVYGCPYERYHFNSLSHAINKSDACEIEKKFNYCSIFKSSPEELIKSRWIRPDDLDVYLNMGFSDFHIIDNNPNQILNVLQAYENKKFNGNLISLLNYDLNKKIGAFIENQNIPKNFLEKFNNINCSFTDCNSCGWCSAIAEQAVIVFRHNGGYYATCTRN